MPLCICDPPAEEAPAARAAAAPAPAAAARATAAAATPAAGAGAGAGASQASKPRAQASCTATSQRYVPQQRYGVPLLSSDTLTFGAPCCVDVCPAVIPLPARPCRRLLRRSYGFSVKVRAHTHSLHLFRCLVRTCSLTAPIIARVPLASAAPSRHSGSRPRSMTMMWRACVTRSRTAMRLACAR